MAVEKKSLLNFGPVYLLVRIGFSNRSKAAEQLKKKRKYCYLIRLFVVVVWFFDYFLFHPWESTAMKDRQENCYHPVIL